MSGVRRCLGRTLRAVHRSSINLETGDKICLVCFVSSSWLFCVFACLNSLPLLPWTNRCVSIYLSFHPLKRTYLSVHLDIYTAFPSTSLATCLIATNPGELIAIMSADQMSYAPSAAAGKQIPAHPLCPVTAAEIKQSAHLIRSLYPANTDFAFKVITLEEPEKAHLVPYLDAEHSRGRLPQIDRKIFVCYYLRNTVS